MVGGEAKGRHEGDDGRRHAEAPGDDELRLPRHGAGGAAAGSAPDAAWWTGQVL